MGEGGSFWNEGCCWYFHAALGVLRGQPWPVDSESAVSGFHRMMPRSCVRIRAFWTRRASVQEREHKCSQTLVKVGRVVKD